MSLGRLSAMTLTAFALVVIGTARARPEPATIGMTAYLREGPGTRFRPVDEALAGREADVLGCQDGWCHITLGTLDGYVPQAAILSDPLGGVGERQSCFVNRQAGYGSGRDLRLCHAAPGP